jgi:hypothetical protein
MFLVAPDIGRSASHHAFLPELFTRIGVGGLWGMLSLIVGVYQECFQGGRPDLSEQVPTVPCSRRLPRTCPTFCVNRLLSPATHWPPG